MMLLITSPTLGRMADTAPSWLAVPVLAGLVATLAALVWWRVRGRRG